MKRFFALSFAAIALLFACGPENSGSQNDPDKLTITGEALDVTGYSATLTGYANLPLELGDAEVGIMYDKQQSFEGAKKVAATELDGNNKFTVIATGLESSTTYFYKSYVQNNKAIKYGAVKKFTTKTIPAGAVDLGIVMTREDGTTYRLYWAKSNLSTFGLCADEKDSGDFYAWGETEPYYTEGHSLDNPCSSWRARTDYPITGYNWFSYKFRTSGESNDDVKFSKYNTSNSYGPVDNITELQRGEKKGETMDDAARAKLGGKWRMPTDAEWTALRTQCSWKWVYWYNESATSGMIVTSNIDGFKDKSIFLPYKGCRVNSSIVDMIDDVPLGSSYWSSSLNPGGAPFRALTINLGITKGESIFKVRRSISNRSDGLLIRPVTE